MKNDFNKEEINRWFIFNYTCWWCGKNTANSFHHILGRSSNSRTNGIYRSILNAAPLCNYSCHISIHGILRRPEHSKILLKKTVKFLLKQGYEFTEKDIQFIKVHKDIYSELVDNSELRKIKKVL